MLFVDVNILVYGHRPEAPRHEDYRRWIDEARVGDEPVAVSDLVLASFLRVVTHPKVFKEPTPVEVGLEYAHALRTSPSVMPVRPGERVWPLLVDLVQAVEARGTAMPDALIAAQAIEQGATLITADRGFARFSGLDWRHPLD